MGRLLAYYRIIETFVPGSIRRHCIEGYQIVPIKPTKISIQPLNGHLS